MCTVTDDRCISLMHMHPLIVQRQYCSCLSFARVATEVAKLHAMIHHGLMNGRRRHYKKVDHFS